MKNFRPLAFIGAIFIALIIFIVMLKEKSTDKKSTTLRQTITTTAYPAFFIANKIANNNFNVVNLTTNSPDAHDFEPTLQALESIKKSFLAVLIGRHLDDWAINASKEANNRIDLSLSVHLIKYKGEDGINPHYWMDFDNMKLMSKAISLKLSSIDAANSAVYTGNADALNTTIDKLSKEYSVLSECKNKSILVSHNAYDYMLNKQSVDILSITNDDHIHSEPSIATLSKIIQEAKNKKIKIVFYESDETKKVAEIVAKELGVPVRLLYTLEAETTKGVDFIGMLNENLKNLKEAMSCQ